MGLKSLLFAAALSTLQPAIPSFAGADDLTTKQESDSKNQNSDYIEFSLIGAYNLQKIALKDWSTDDFREYVLQDPWPAGFGTNLGGQFTINDVTLRANWYRFDTQGIFSDLLKLSGGFDKTFSESESIDGIISGTINSEARVRGRWEANSDADVLSLGIALPIDHQGKFKSEATFTLDYFKYFISGTASGTITGQGDLEISLFDREPVVVNMNQDYAYDLRADISGRGLTALLGPKASYEFGDFEFTPSLVLYALTGLSIIPGHRIHSATIYGSALLELIVEDQQYSFRVQDQEINLPDDVNFSRRNDNVSIGYDFGLLFEVYPDYFLNLEIHGDSGLTDVLEVGLRKEF